MGDSDQDPEEIYELIQSVGEGSYGAVWKGVNKITKETCAIKIIPVDDDLSELKKEISILKKCESEYVVTYYGSYEKDKHVWIVMELCEAGSVNDLMHICEVSFQEPMIKTICASVLLGLAYLHEHRMIHRDVKAGNVLLSTTGHAKLADFGVSAQLSTIHSKRKTVIGTPFWMAPEVIQESQYNGKADIWSLGITLIELAELEPPYSNIHPMRAIFMIPSRPPPKFHDPSRWSNDMNDFLAKCLIKNPDERPTARELMSHPFVADTVKELQESKGVSSSIRDLVAQHAPRINEFRTEEMNRAQAQNSNNALRSRGNTALYEPGKAGTLQHNTGQQQYHQSVGNPGTLLSTGTVVLQSGISTTATGQGTAIRVAKSGTMNATDTIKTSGTRDEPSFMSYFQTTKKGDAVVVESPKRVSARPGDGFTPEEVLRLKNRIRLLDIQFRKDFTDLKQQYDKRKNALISASGTSAP